MQVDAKFARTCIPFGRRLARTCVPFERASRSDIDVRVPGTEYGSQAIRAPRDLNKMADHSWRGHGRFSAPNSLRGQMSSPNRPPPLMQKHVLPPDVRNRGNQFAAPMPGVFEPRPLRYPLGRSFARGPSPRGPGRNTPSFPRPRMPVRIPIDYKFAGMEVQSRFPNPKEKLHNILQCATKQPRGVHYTHANVDGQYWSATVHMEWPRASSFTGEGFEKKDAERRAAALACAHLLVGGILSNSRRKYPCNLGRGSLALSWEDLSFVMAGALLLISLLCMDMIAHSLLIHSHSSSYSFIHSTIHWLSVVHPSFLWWISQPFHSPIYSFIQSFVHSLRYIT